jgi:hypothetical protein
MSNSFPPVKLFHYAPILDFIAIAESHSLWLSPIDSQKEINEALKLIKSVVTKEYTSLNPDLFNADMLRSYPVFSFALTGQKNLGSLWKHYCPDGGYSIAIDNEQLTAMMETNNLMLSKCLYDEAEIRNFVINSIVEINPGDYIESIGQANPTCVLDPRHLMFPKEIKLINRNILNYAGILKDQSQRDNQEWRVTTYYTWSGIFMGPTDVPPEPLSLPIQSREINHVIVPYVAPSLVSSTFTKVHVEEVVIGPAADMTVAALACQFVLNQCQDGKNAIVSNSI